MLLQVFVSCGLSVNQFFQMVIYCIQEHFLLLDWKFNDIAKMLTFPIILCKVCKHFGMSLHKRRGLYVTSGNFIWFNSPNLTNLIPSLSSVCHQLSHVVNGCMKITRCLIEVNEQNVFIVWIYHPCDVIYLLKLDAILMGGQKEIWATLNRIWIQEVWMKLRPTVFLVNLKGENIVIL